MLSHWRRVRVMAFIPLVPAEAGTQQRFRNAERALWFRFRGNERMASGYDVQGGIRCGAGLGPELTFDRPQSGPINCSGARGKQSAPREDRDKEEPP